MAEGDGLIYNEFKSELMNGTHDLGSGGHTLKLALVSGYTPDIDAHALWADVSATDYITSAGYTAGGATVGSQTVAVDDVDDRGVFNAADVTWSSLGPLSPATPSDCVLYNDTPTSPLKPLISTWEIATATNGGDYTVQWSNTPAAIILLT